MKKLAFLAIMSSLALPSASMAGERTLSLTCNTHLSLSSAALRIVDASGGRRSIFVFCGGSKDVMLYTGDVATIATTVRHEKLGIAKCHKKLKDWMGSLDCGMEGMVVTASCRK